MPKIFLSKKIFFNFYIFIFRDFWQEIGPKWPPGFWDDFIREPAQRKNRSCIRPELSRTGMTNFGQKGASGLVFVKKFF